MQLHRHIAILLNTVVFYVN